MRRIAWTLDLLSLVAVGYVAVLWITGGGEFEIAGAVVKARRGGAVLHVLFAITLIRVFALREVVWLPFAGNLARARAATEFFTRLPETLAGSPHSVTRILLVLVAVSLAFKVGNAWNAEGFFSGDDTELLDEVISNARGFGHDAWELRNSFYPRVFLEPVVVLAERLGASTGTLVFLARCLVAVLSVIGLFVVAAVARRHAGTDADGSVAAVAAAALLLLNGPETQFASSVLPRPVVAVALIAAIHLLDRRTVVSGVIAALLLGVAAAIRFSEVVALPAAVVVLAVQRRFVAALAIPFIAAVTAAAIWSLFDLVEGRAAFDSLRSIVEFTLVEGASTRGVQPWHHYLTTAPAWIGLPALILMGWAVRARGSSLWLWLLVPVFALSTLPHKETRYVVPFLPVVAVVAGIGFARWVQWARVHSDSRWWGAPVLAAIAVLAVVYGLDDQRIRRSDGAVLAARHLAGVEWVDSVVFQQAWKGGTGFYLRGVEVIDLEPSRLRRGDASELREVMGDEVDAVVVQIQVAGHEAVAQFLADQGFGRWTGAWERDDDPHAVFLRRR